VSCAAATTPDRLGFLLHRTPRAPGRALCRYRSFEGLLRVVSGRIGASGIKHAEERIDLDSLGHDRS
jgi:hypothetical protein